MEVLGLAAEQAGNAAPHEGAAPPSTAQQPAAGDQDAPAVGPSAPAGLHEEGIHQREWPDPGKLDQARLATRLRTKMSKLTPRAPRARTPIQIHAMCV